MMDCLSNNIEIKMDMQDGYGNNDMFVKILLSLQR